MARYFEITLEVYSHRIKYSMSTQGLQKLDFTNLLCNQRRQELNAGILNGEKDKIEYESSISCKMLSFR